MKITLLIVLAGGLAIAGALAPPARAQEQPGPLCGVAVPVDQILGCSAASQPGKPSPPSGAPASGQSLSGLQIVQPHRIPLTPRYVPSLLLLTFERGTSQEEQAKIVEEAGAVVERRIARLGVVVVRMPPAQRDRVLARLRAEPAVGRAQKSLIFERLDTTPNDAVWSEQWGLRRVGLPSVWDRTRGSTGIVVAVLDTGVDAGHPDLQGAVLPGYDFVNGDADARDDNGHGTAVAGIIAARTNNRVGVAGICWTCSILPLKVLDADGRGDTSRLAAAVVRAADAGARIIAMSLGGPATDPTLTQAVEYALGKGAILVGAAGNNGVAIPFYPAATPGVVSVGATDQGDHLYKWSNFGPWVRIAAPGCNAAPGLSASYVIFCGTSSATPLVAGLIALQVSARPGASRDEIVDAAERTAVPIGDVVSRGRVDAAAAVAAIAPAAPPSSTPVATTLSTLTFRGVLTPHSSSRVFRRPVETGILTTRLTFSGAPTLTLTIRDQAGAFVARASGKSPLRLDRRLPTGTYSVAVSSGRSARAAFTLAISAPKATG